MSIGGSAVGVILERKVTGLHNGAVGCGCVERGDSLAAGGTTLSKRSLGRELQFYLTGQIHGFKSLVLADVAGNHLLDLLGLEELAEAGAVGACVVGDGCEALDVRPLENLVDESIGHTTETKATT